MQPAQKYIDAFEALAARRPGPVSWSFSIDSGKPGPHALFSSIIHGNETGSLPAVLETLSALDKGQIDFIGKMTFFLGNVPASRKNIRFIEADLNRVFTETGADTAERRRALELMPLLETADVYIDFHQTTMPCVEPFFIFGYEHRSYLWARSTGAARVLVTRSAKEKFTAHALCIDEYARKFNIPSMTIELGQAGLTEQAEKTSRVIIQKVIENLKLIHSGKATLESLAAEQEEFRFLTVTHKVMFEDPSQTLKEGHINLGKVKKGDLMGHSSREQYFCPADGELLFPKYPKRDDKGMSIDPLTGELYMLLEPLKEHPHKLWG